MTILRFFLSIAITLVASTAWCGTRSALNPMRMAAMRVLNSSRNPQLVATLPNMEVYENNNGGFAIVAGNATSPKVLAYSPSGSFQQAADNPGFSWWLKAVGNATLKETPKPDTTRFAPFIAPLITSKWGQNEPCRYMCPFLEYNPDLSKYGIYIPDSTHNAVGCGPAAMAQLMYYYKYPQHGTGSASVVVKYDQANVTLNVDFESAAYDWQNMLDDYSGTYSTANGMAVAQLCYHAAVAAKANWTRLGGATFDEDILNAMINHFNYNDSARFIPRPLYQDQEWMDMLYTMLNNGQPVLYSGKDINFQVGILVGHNFIIDGYDEQGLVHVNWGWHGSQDGYFDIATLTTGILSFDDWQGMYVDLYPEVQTIAGDVNGDGLVNVMDVTAVINHILGDTPTHFNSQAADINNDNSINVIDVTAIINHILTGL